MLWSHAPGHVLRSAGELPIETSSVRTTSLSNPTSRTGAPAALPLPVTKDRILVAYPHRGRIAHLVRVRRRTPRGWRGAAECAPGVDRPWLPVPSWLAPGAVLCPACVAHAASCAACAEALRPYSRR